jgi:hypothetical protein
MSDIGARVSDIGASKLVPPSSRIPEEKPPFFDRRQRQAVIPQRADSPSGCKGQRRQKNTNAFSGRRFPNFGLETPETSPMLPIGVGLFSVVLVPHFVIAPRLLYLIGHLGADKEKDKMTVTGNFPYRSS